MPIVYQKGRPMAAPENGKRSARQAGLREGVKGLPCGADTKDQGAAFAAPENRERRTENRAPLRGDEEVTVHTGRH